MVIKSHRQIRSWPIFTYGRWQSLQLTAWLVARALFRKDECSYFSRESMVRCRQHVKWQIHIKRWREIMVTWYWTGRRLSLWSKMCRVYYPWIFLLMIWCISTHVTWWRMNSCYVVKNEFMWRDEEWIRCLVRDGLQNHMGPPDEIFLGMEIEQSDKIHRDNYLKEVVAKDSDYIRRARRCSSFQMSHSRQRRSCPNQSSSAQAL